MATQKVTLTNAAEVDIEVTEGDKLDATNATITITDAAGTPIDLTVFTEVQLNIYRDEEFKSKIYTFSKVGATLTTAVGSFVLLADPFSLVEDTYRYGLREADSPLTLATGHFIVKKKY